MTIYLIIGIIIGCFIVGIMIACMCKADSLYYSDDIFVHYIQVGNEEFGSLAMVACLTFVFVAFIILWPLLIITLVIILLSAYNQIKESE